MTRVIRSIAHLPTLVLLVAGVAGCRPNPVSFYEAPREQPGSRPPGPLSAAMTTNAARTPTTAARLEWTKPEAWTEKPASQMRLASFGYTAPNGDEADISVFSFPDAAGGLLANINRWRGQVSLDPVTEADLPTTAEQIEVAGRPAWSVDLLGTAKGGGGPMMAAAPKASGPTRIIGTIVPVDGMSWFFKMMGPDDVVVAQRDTFHEFIASIRAATAPSAAPGDMAGNPHAGVPGAPPLNTSAGGSGGMDPSAVPPPPKPDGFSFDTPPGWDPQPTNQFRLASFQVPGDGAAPADVSVTAFPGMTGQDLANVNRWRGQVNLAPISESEVAQLRTTIEAHGLTFELFDFESLMPTLEDGKRSRILAAMLKRGPTIWFFKMTGESELVDSQRDNFVGFLRSFQFEETP